MEIDYRSNANDSRHQLRIPQLRCELHCFPEGLVRRLITLGPSQGLAQPIENKHPGNANFPIKVCEAATSRLDCLRETASQDERVGQLAKAFPDHLAIAEADGDFDYFAEIGQRRVPSLKTRLRNREPGQKLGPFFRADGSMMRQGDPKAGPRLLKCSGVESTVACQRQKAKQLLLVSKRSSLDEMTCDLTGALIDSVWIELLNCGGGARVQLFLAWD